MKDQEIPQIEIIMFASTLRRYLNCHSFSKKPDFFNCFEASETVTKTINIPNTQVDRSDMTITRVSQNLRTKSIPRLRGQSPSRQNSQSNRRVRK